MRRRKTHNEIRKEILETEREEMRQIQHFSVKSKRRHIQG
jgi:hypothetical protein